MSKKPIKTIIIVKRLVTLLMVIVMSMTSFAAVVSDNDGAAFITKAEFDSLKNEFQAEINEYNSSLDNKIDGAIASYLEGIKINKKSKLKSTLEVAGQTYQGTSRKSYVFCGNNSVYFMCRYNYENSQFVNYGVDWSALPNLRFTYNNCISSYALRPGNISNGGYEMYGADQFQFKVGYYYRPYDNAGNPIPVAGAPLIFIVDANNYVTGYKYNCELQGRVYRVADGYSNEAEIMALPFVANDSYKWKFTWKDVVGANGTNGMGYSTRALGDYAASEFTGYRYQMFANESSSRSGWVYLGRTIRDRSGNYTRYIMNRGSSTAPYSINQGNYGSNASCAEWLDTHLHFEESRFGESYAWCMPFGHSLDRTAACFKQWPAWESVNWAYLSTQNVGSINATTDRIFTDVSGQHHWRQDLSRARICYMNGISRNYFGADELDVQNYVEFDGMLPIWKEIPLKDWRLLKNSNIKNALGIDAYYTAAPPLTAAFKKAGTFTWVAKVNQQDKERIPGRTWDNWGNTRIYFTSAPMSDTEISGTNVKVSNTKKFKYKRLGSGNDYSDCQSQVISGKTYYYLTLMHDEYYEFKMDVDANETVYYMIFDEKRPNDYCLEVIEHPDYQIEFTET